MVGEHSRRIAQTTEPGQSASAVASTARVFALQWVIDGSLGRVDLLRGARLRIGRGDDCHLRLEHGSVSRSHAELYRQGPIYALRDFGSRNGTWVNGQPVEHTAISAGDVLRFGDCLAVVTSVASGLPQRNFGSIAPGVWGGPALAAAIAQVVAAARSNVPIVIVGETGTGKERVARAIHELSGRNGRFNAINCSTVPGPLAEAELFGHLRGAFTGAERARPGHFQAAHAGTLFLDEISDLSLDVQAKLLRVVETGELVPLGGTGATQVDVRIVVASHEPLDALVEQQRFRADLAARLLGFTALLPPLRERREEIPGFFLHHLREHGSGAPRRVAPALMEWICLRDWPGNVRELELMARKLLALHGAEPELRLSFAQALSGGAPAATSTPPSGRLGFQDRRASDLHRLRQALEQTGGNLKAAAEAIGIPRRRAYRLLEAERALEPGGEEPSEEEPA